MRVSDIVYGPWALRTEKLLELQEIYAMHLRGERVDLAAAEARMGRQLANEPKPYQVVNGVGIVPVHGIMAPKASLFMDVSGAVSTQRIIQQLQQAKTDPDVRAIIGYFDTPGGSTFLTPELGAAFRAASLVKPTVALTDGQMCSAGYWAGSGAAKVFATGPTVQVGHIGVAWAHRDVSRAEAAAGIKTTEITAGKFKRINGSYEPLSQDGRAYMQETVDYLYTLFVGAVADYRGVPIEKVLAEMAEGRVFIGQQALDVGLIDGFMTLDDLIEQLATDPAGVVGAPPRQKTTAISASTTTGAQAPVSSSERTTMSTTPPDQAATAAAISAAIAGLTSDGLKSGNPGLFAALQTQFTAAGATAERERIKAVQDQSMPGHQQLIQTLMFDGKTTGPEAAVQVLAAQRQALGKAADAHFGDAPAAAASSSSAAASQQGAKTRQQKDAEAHAYAKEHNTDYVTAWKALGFE